MRIPWNKGKKTGQVPWNKGKKGEYKRTSSYIFSEEHKRNMSEAKRGRKLSEETKRKIRDANRGKKRSEEVRKNISEGHKGEKNPLWRGGITSINLKLRRGIEYKLWREAIFKRDNYTCIWCGQRGIRLNADHIKSWAHYPALRFAIDNGRTLCIPCHKKTDTWGYHKRSL